MGVSRYVPGRVAAIAVSLGIALSMLAGAVPARAAATTTDPGQAAAGWVAAQVEAGGLGAGSLADAIFAFAATRVGGTAGADALDQLGAALDGYAGYGGTLKPGPLGKAMLAVTVAGADPTAFDGHDLVSDLRAMLVTSGADAGRFGSAGVFDQALDILAFAATPGGVPAGAGDWLAARQCPSGEYSFDGSCPSTAGSEDPDTTAVALQALLAAGSTTAADRAAQWLVDLQAPDGSVAAYGTPNTNSTGATAEALRAAGKVAQADAAAAWVAGRQYGCGARAADRGAIPWTTASPGTLILSTPQALLAFGAPRLDELALAGASAVAPILRCAVATPRPVPTGAGAPTLPPTDGGVAGGPSGPSTDQALLLTIVLTLAFGALVAGLGPGARRWHR